MTEAASCRYTLELLHKRANAVSKRGNSMLSKQGQTMLELVNQNVKPDEVGFSKETQSRGELTAQLLGRAATDLCRYAAFYVDVV